MSDPSPVKVSETCWCGTEVTVEGVSWAEAADYVTGWRDGHRHRDVREAEHVGFAAVGFADGHGQPASKARPWGPA